jgi:two-component system, OmpR family, sensor kinase
MRKLPPVGLSVKVGLILFVVVAGALAIVYVAVVPQLESRLVDAKLDEVTHAFPGVKHDIVKESDWTRRQDTMSRLSESIGARILLLETLSEDELVIVRDTRQFESGGSFNDPVALEAFRTNRRSSGRVTRNGADFAEVASPLDDGTILLLSAPLADALATVHVVKRSLLVAGVASLAISWLAGYLLAWNFTRRIRRLEGAAERLAEGDFETPVVDAGRDEVAQLADAFDGMRARLAALDRARGEFIANASHELRTPLFSLGGFVELLADERMDPEVRRDFLGEMRDQITRLTRLATDLLDLSRLDAGQLRVETAPFDLAASARLVADEFRALADAEGHVLHVQADTLVGALGDELRAQQIARALVENALRHTPAGTLVEVSVERRDGQAVLEVRDDGPGIRADDQAHLLQRFYRAAGGKAFGSGLGLAIASELTALMDGALDFRSQPGETIFTLALRVAPEGALPGERTDDGEPVSAPADESRLSI